MTFEEKYHNNLSESKARGEDKPVNSFNNSINSSIENKSSPHLIDKSFVIQQIKEIHLNQDRYLTECYDEDCKWCKLLEGLEK